MMKEEQLRICILLAFQSMITQGKDVKSKSTAAKITQLAKLMNEFCNLHFDATFPTESLKLVDDKWAVQVDAALNNHIDELTKKEQTTLPVDRESLIQFYDRLQQRRVRREQWLFYANATEEELQDKVLRCLDAEIEDRQKAQ